MASGWLKRRTAGACSRERRRLNRRPLACYVDWIQPISISMAAFLCTDCIVLAMVPLRLSPPRCSGFQASRWRG